MKKFLNLFIIFILVVVGVQKLYANSLADSALLYVEEFRSIVEERGSDLWGVKVEAPVLFVDTAAGLVYLSEAVDVEDLQTYNSIWTTRLTDENNVTTPTLLWQEKKWVVVTLANQRSHQEIIEFIAHESFHCIQDQLNIRGSSPSLPHLSSTMGKTLIQAEAMELLAALKTDFADSVHLHLKNALTLRYYRYQLFPDAEEIEGRAELNEGLAEYTGMRYANYLEAQLLEEYQSTIDKLASSQAEMAYPYISGSIYAYLNDIKSDSWKSEVPEKYLHELTRSIFKIDISDSESGAKLILEMPVYKQLKEDIKNISSDGLKDLFSHKLLILESANSQFHFKSNVVVSIPEMGTAYNNIVISSSWGKLVVDVSGRVLITSTDNMILLNASNISNNENVISGDGWVLTLKEGWDIEKDDLGNLILTEK